MGLNTELASAISAVIINLWGREADKPEKLAATVQKSTSNVSGRESVDTTERLIHRENDHEAFHDMRWAGPSWAGQILP